MKFKILKFAILLAIITSCSKDPGPCGGQKTYYYLSEADKAKVPYAGTDTLVFVSNTNDTAVCIGQGKKQFFTVEYDSGNPDCKPPEYYYEAYNYKYDCLNTNFKLDLNIFKKFDGQLEIINPIVNSKYFFIYCRKVYDNPNSIDIRGIIYNNVSSVFMEYNDSAYQLFYNNKNGILKIENKDKSVIWELIK